MSWIRKRLGCAFLCYPAVHILLMLRRPTTIAGFVVAVIIDSVDAMRRRRLASHIGEKVGVAFAPPFTDFNPARSIPFIRFDMWYFTSSDHRLPSIIL